MKTTKPRIQIAMDLVAKGKTPREAAVAAGIAETSVYAKIKQLKALEAGVCPTCGGPVNEDGQHKAGRR